MKDQNPAQRMKPLNEKKIRNKKRIVVSDVIQKRIKKMISQGFNSKIIAKEVKLPVGVVKRFYKADYFKVKNKKQCSNCGTKINKGITCSKCKKNADKYSEDAFFMSMENRPSDMSCIGLNSITNTYGNYKKDKNGK